jgi:DNA-binding GntR family transcriptional regulator
MRKNLEDALAGVGDSAAATLERLEEEMHVGLLGYCGNRAVMQALTLPQSLLTAHRFLFRWIPCLFVNEPCFREHLEIVLRLQDGDARAAAAKLEVHLGLARDRAIARVEQVRREFSAEDLPYLARV